MQKNKIKPLLPLLTLRGIVAHPNVIMHFDVKREKSLNALELSMKNDRKIFIVTQKDSSIEEPKISDLYKVGVICSVKQLVKNNNNTVRVLVSGEEKAILTNIVEENSVQFAVTKTFKKQSKIDLNSDEEDAIRRLTKNLFKSYYKMFPNPSKDVIAKVNSKNDPYELFYIIFQSAMLSPRDKQELLEQNNIYVALERLADLLRQESNIIGMEHELYQKVKIRMDLFQRHFFLREQQKLIAEELGDNDPDDKEVIDLIIQIKNINNMSPAIKQKLFKEGERLRKLPAQSQEANVIRSYLEVCVELPFDKSTKDKLDINEAQKRLDRDHYGMDKVKERILEVLAVRKMNPDIKGQIICLVGPPGVGKTSIAASVAKALNRKYARISLGGVTDESEIRGHRKTYLGAMPGRIINALRQVKSNNPLILFDEIDKMGRDYKGDPYSALLEVLDPEQNKEFVDHYMEIPFDLSGVLFLTTANSLRTIPAPLLDRMDIIELSSYTREEKFNITKKYLVKKQVTKHGLSSKQIIIKNDAIYDLIDSYTKEAGVRNLERKISDMCRKTAKAIVSKKEDKIIFTKNNIEEYLGPRRYKKLDSISKAQVGVVNGLAWTSVGGELLPIETCIMPGTGKIKLTGSLGNVMKESADIAISYARSVCDKYNINPDFYKLNDIHIHAPEGAVPKDGPSAGVTMATALISSLANIAVRGDIAMTGEISLRGNVMPIGGLREKAMAAYRENKKLVLIPKDNEPDLFYVDNIVKESVSFIPVETIAEVLDIALIKVDNGNRELPISNWCDINFSNNEPLMV